MQPANRTVFPLPASKGTSWSQPTRTAMLEKTGPPQRTEYRIRVPLVLDNTIVSINDRVQVPAGSFSDCIRIQGKGSAQVDAANYVGRASVEVETTKWYAPSVGLIKMLRKEFISSPAIDPGEYQVVLQAVRRE